ncbi:MAG: heavy metal translocating P-type ATPase metal-binding domain-containing protein [Bacteroidia bacterium]|nr:heavy metal translocating P-type ATPase metal-binding domain-containing protein [Bacteroidia bacterium]
MSTDLPESTLHCYHCGDICPDDHIHIEEKAFCCEGCKTVYQILSDNGMCTYYDLSEHPGIALKAKPDSGEYAWLDNEDIRHRLLDYRDESQERLRFFLPQIHCSSCIWLLENLYKLRPGIFQSRVDFLKKEISLSYDPNVISLRELANLLATLGYAPDIRLSDATSSTRSRNSRNFYLRLGVAGFAYGNIMLMSFPEYLGLDAVRDWQFVSFFGLLNLLLAIPVLLYSATDFYKSAWIGLRERQLNIDVPITIGIVTLFGRSAWEILTHAGPGYMDSLAGLVFFLLAGRWFQNKTYDALAFDRDFSSYFPLAATKLSEQGEESCLVTDLVPGDRLLVRNQELIPADAILQSETAHIDYSFVTGESDPVEKNKGDMLFAGGRQMGSSIELTLVKEVSQSYLTQLWNDEAFQKDDESRLRSFTDRSARLFTAVVLLVAAVAGMWWWISEGPGMAVNVFTAVLIVACPCALALSIPVTLGNAMRILGRQRMYLKNTRVLERLSQITHIVWDKTGTMTHKGGHQLDILLSPDLEDQALIAKVAAQSTHPLSRSISRQWHPSESAVYGWAEQVGQGSEGEIAGHRVVIGRDSFVGARLRQAPESAPAGTWIAVDGLLVGVVKLRQSYRAGLRSLIGRLSKRYTLSILSGDNTDEASRLRSFFPADTEMRFGQTPQQKLDYIRATQEQHATVMMIGDGLNDAGALRQSDIGVAVSEDVHTFTPACDLILDANSLQQTDQLLAFSRGSMRWVRRGLLLSLGYNLVGLSIAVQGLLSPLLAAILMPLSSITIVVLGMTSTSLLSWKIFRKTSQARQQEVGAEIGVGTYVQAD